MIPILMYHGVGHPPPTARLRSLYVSPGKFARQMALLHALGLRGVSMSQALPFLRGERTGRVVALTFDDGYRDNLHAALPVLSRYGFTATCYVVSGALGGYNVWDAEQLNVRKRLMDRAEVRAWHAAGMEVGAHTRSHPRLTTCPDAALQDEVAGAKAELEDLLGAEVTQFCYPYGDHDTRVVEQVRAAGLQAATTIRRGRARVGDDLFRLPRVFIGGPNLLHLFALKTLTAYEDRRG